MSEDFTTTFHAKARESNTLVDTFFLISINLSSQKLDQLLHKPPEHQLSVLNRLEPTCLLRFPSFSRRQIDLDDEILAELPAQAFPQGYEVKM